MMEPERITCPSCGQARDIDSWTADVHEGLAYCPMCQAPRNLVDVLSVSRHPRDFGKEAEALFGQLSIGGKDDPRLEKIRLALKDAYDQGRRNVVA